jgi:hypothetical protein
MDPHHPQLDLHHPHRDGDGSCTCERPRPQVRAERKWAATTYCLRCGLPLPLAWR